MSVAESKVSGIIKSLGELETDLDSLESKASGMKKQLHVRTMNAMDAMLEKARGMAATEAQAMINAAKEQASAESAKIGKDAESKLSDIRSAIDANFDKAVGHVVSTVLKP